MNYVYERPPPSWREKWASEQRFVRWQRFQSSNECVIFNGNCCGGHWYKSMCARQLESVKRFRNDKLTLIRNIRLSLTREHDFCARVFYFLFLFFYSWKELMWTKSQSIECRVPFVRSLYLQRRSFIRFLCAYVCAYIYLFFFLLHAQCFVVALFVLQTHSCSASSMEHILRHADTLHWFFFHK